MDNNHLSLKKLLKNVPLMYLCCLLKENHIFFIDELNKMNNFFITY